MATTNASLTAKEQQIAETIYRQSFQLRDEMVMPELIRQLSRAFSWYTTSPEFAKLDEEERQHVSRYYMAIADLMETIDVLMPYQAVV